MKTESEIIGLKKTAIVIVALVLASIAFAFWADALVGSWINRHTSGSLRHTAVVVSRIGDWPAHVALGIIGMIAAFFARRKDWVRIFLVMLTAFAVSGVAARVIKITTGRARPLVQSERVWTGPSLSAKYNAFPSGHTASSTAFFAALFFARRKIGAPLLAIPVIIAAARVLARAHYLSDVFFAAALGLACALLICRFIPVQAPSQPHLPGDSTL